MPKTITKVAYPPRLQSKKKVAAYCRVSSGKDAMLHSLSAQVSYYNELIHKERDWEFVGVYSDEALTGTKDSRTDFQRLIADCRAGKIDMVITKSISRFARNTVTLLQTVREFKAMEVDIYFEEQHIHTMSADGELMLTILASYAQEESRSASENQKWRIKKNFSEGKPWSGTILGYRYFQGRYIIVPEEAELVRRIYNLYLKGLGTNAIAQTFNEEGLRTKNGHEWYKSTIDKILKNYNYTGNLLLQKTYRENHISKITSINNGELPKYHATETHEAIIPLETFATVQKEFARRAEKYAKNDSSPKRYPFTQKIVCGICGRTYRRKTATGRVAWSCSTYDTKGKVACASKKIPEPILMQCAADVMGSTEFDAVAFELRIDHIEAFNGNRLIFYFKDGTAKEVYWKDRSRSESWTPEMRKAAGQKTKQRLMEEKQWQEQSL